MARWSDEQIELAMGRVLQAGVVLASAVMLVGAVAYLIRHGTEIPEYHVFLGAAPDLRTMPGVVAGIAQGRARAYIQLGVLIMIATPVLRVVLAIYGFARERDGIYVVISLIVLGILSYGLLTLS